MNRAILEKLIHQEPKDAKSRYVFLHDSRQICEAIITVGFRCVYIAPKADSGFFDVESFVEYIRDQSDAGTCLMSYVFVLACFKKKTNDAIESILKAHQIEYRVGAYSLFRDKEYLGKYDYQDELEKILNEYVNRFEGPNEVAVNREQFIKRDPDGREKGIMEKALVDYIIETVNFFVVGTAIYIYSDGVFSEDSLGIKVKSIIQGLLYDRYISYRTINSVYRLLIDQPQVQRTYEELNAYPSHWINFRNGMFDIKAGKLHKHNPKYLSINQIPYDLRLDVRDKLEEMGQETEKFLNYSVPDKTDQMMLFQYIGYCMTTDTCMQKFMILRGTGGTGKSSIISMIQRIIGLENTSSVSMQDLNQRFYPAQMRGKLLNACADISAQALDNIDVIKKATGEDLLIYEKKGMDPTTFRSYAKLLFSANQIPLNLDEKSDALYRRMLILVMDKKPKVMDRELNDKLAAEVDYWIWKAMYALKILYNKGEFAESDACQEEVERLHRAADTVKAFMDERTCKHPGAEIKRELLYEQYVEYCKGYGRKSHGPSTFYRALEDKGYILKRKSSGRYILDVEMVDDGFLEVDEHEKVPFVKK